MSSGFGEERQADFHYGSDKPGNAAHSARSGGDPLQVKLKLGPGGRVVIPAEMRTAMELKEGDTLIGSFDGESLTLTAFNHMVREIQKEMTARVPRGVSVVDELIAQRREDARREEEGR